jgi:uncharacterized protein
MQLTARTTVHALLEEYPFAASFLRRYGHDAAAYAAPEARRKVGRMVDMQQLAVAAGVPVSRLLADLQQHVAEATGEAPRVVSAPARESDPQRRERFSAIMRELYDGAGLDEVKDRFGVLMEEVHGEEFAALQRDLLAQDATGASIERLFREHTRVFGDRNGAEVVAPEGHPLHTLQAEVRALGKIAARLRVALEGLGRASSPTWRQLRPRVERLIERLVESERHLCRMERLVLPRLRAGGSSAPARLVETAYADLRTLLPKTRDAVAQGSREATLELGTSLLAVIDEIVYKEARILLPLADERLADADWREIRAAEPAYGWAFVTAPPPWPGEGAALRGSPAAAAGTLSLASGRMTAEQLSRVLMHLPLDITFIDADDRVLYFSGGDRIVARAPGDIGRRAPECAAPVTPADVAAAIATVREGARDEVTSWVAAGDRRLRVTYTRLRHDGRHVGVLEVVQDATAVQTLAPCGFFDAAPSVIVRGATPITDGVRAQGDRVALDFGALSVSEIDLVIAALPLDFSYADEHDTLLQFAGAVYDDCDREAIGASLQDCHPPASHAALARVLDELRGGRRQPFDQVTEEHGVWRHVRYLGVRDSDGTYRGVLEVQQDLSPFK